MKYIVRIREIHLQGVEVEAESIEEALEKVAAGEGDYDTGIFELVGTTEPDKWDVLDENGYLI